MKGEECSWSAWSVGRIYCAKKEQTLRASKKMLPGEGKKKKSGGEDRGKKKEEFLGSLGCKTGRALLGKKVAWLAGGKASHRRGGGKRGVRGD